MPQVRKNPMQRKRSLCDVWCKRMLEKKWRNKKKRNKNNDKKKGKKKYINYETWNVYEMKRKNKFKSCMQNMLFKKKNRIVLMWKKGQNMKILYTFLCVALVKHFYFIFFFCLFMFLMAGCVSLSLYLDNIATLISVIVWFVRSTVSITLLNACLFISCIPGKWYTSFLVFCQRSWVWSKIFFSRIFCWCEERGFRFKCRHNDVRIG